jgi:hypothetical protein
MAINVNDVYKAVLVVLDQNNRGPLAPTEFNKIATQAQQEIYTEYFDELNLLLRLPKTDVAQANRIALLEEKIALFKNNTSISFTSGTNVTLTSNIKEVNTVSYNDREVQRIEQRDLYITNKSPLTAPSAKYPVYTINNRNLTVYPTNLTGGVSIDYLSFPSDVKWNFTVNEEFGHYEYSSTGSTDFEIHEFDQPLLVSKILAYAGVLANDQLATSLATSKEQQIEADGQK